MDTLPWIFRSCKVCGIWYEDSRYLYLKILYSGFVGFVIIHFLLSELIELMTTRNSLEDTSEMLFASFNFISCSLKVLNVTSRRSALQSLLSDFSLAIFEPRSPEEEAITSRHNDFITKLFLSYCALSISTGVLLTAVPLLGDELQLPYGGYQMMDVSGSIGFHVACSLQFLAVFYVILISVTLDSLAVGFMILATAQAEVIGHRFANSTLPLKSCIEHQILMGGTVHKIQNFFMPPVVLQFFFSLTTLCSSVFLMSRIPPTDAEFVSFAMCFVSMLSQVFVYCWFGDDLKLKNEELADAVYSGNWVSCDTTERKILAFVMLHAKNATTISFHGQCGLTLNTFIWVAKTSYAAFNLLRKVAN